MVSNSDAYLYRDDGVDAHGNFFLQAVLIPTSFSGLGFWYPFGYSNTLGNQADLNTADDGILVQIQNSNASTFTLQINDLASSTTSSDSTALSVGTYYYLTFQRSGSTATLTIRTFSHTGTVVDTLTHTVSTDEYRYSYLGQSNGSLLTGSTTYTLSAVDVSSGSYIPYHKHRIGVSES